MANVFAGRSLNIIEDFSISERRYLLRKVRELKTAFAQGDTAKVDSFRINNPDYGIYEVFLENSTRTKESFRNAANFQHVKVSELIPGATSLSKGESFADTFNMLTGYHNSLFIVRSTVEGLTKHLCEETNRYALRNNLPYRSAFINAGDGKHEHPTQELLDEFSFLEENGMDFSYIHIALVGDLWHGRTVHSKANGLKIFDKVKVDLVAPEELKMPDSYREKMVENGFEVRSFSSIEEYIENGDTARIWYFTRPQLERMGERILQKQEELRKSITFRKEFLPFMKEGTKFYHPLPRHKEFPTIPTWLDETPLNGWETQAINGYWVRIVLISLIAGVIGDDFDAPEAVTDTEEPDFIIEVPAVKKEKKEISEGMRPITDGIVIDHICKGETPCEIRKHMSLICTVLGIDDGRGGQWVSSGSDGKYKGIIFRPGEYNPERTDLKRLAAIAPGCTLNIIKDSTVIHKFRTTIPPRIYNFEDLVCLNDACITNQGDGEGARAAFHRTPDGQFACDYCGKFHTFKEIWKKR